MGDADYARRPVLGVAAGDDFDAHLVGVLDRAADVRQHRPAADPERRVVVVAARLREVHHGRVGRDEVRAALFHEGERRIRKVRAVLDAPHAGAYCRAGAFIAVGMAHHRYTLRRRGLHDDPQLRLRVHLLAGVLIGLTGTLRRARLDHVHAVVEVHAHQQAERVGCIDAARQLRESRVGEDVVTQVGRDEQAGRQDFRARKDATPHQLAHAHVLEKVGARTPNRRDSRLEGAARRGAVAHVGMGIDQARQHEPALQVDDHGVRRRRHRPPRDACDLSPGQHQGHICDRLRRAAVDHVGVREDDWTLRREQDGEGKHATSSSGRRRSC